MEASNCIFCQIVAGTTPASIVYHDEQVTAFKDTHPVTPVHLLVVPNRHLDSLNQASEADEQLLGHLLLVARQLAVENGIDQRGFRLMLNTGREGGQSVFHLHIHLFGGARLRFNFAVLPR